jgi:hypothetical protein
MGLEASFEEEQEAIQVRRCNLKKLFRLCGVYLEG